MIKNICVFCGSNCGNDPIYKQVAIEFAKEIVENNLTLVYGGGNNGIMGIMSDTIINAGGKVIGVIPQLFYDKNFGNNNITELKVVLDMHTRKKMMYDLSDCFVAFPGGIGTLEEISEAFTWQQIHLHNKPCALLNVNNYYDNLINFLKHSVDTGFFKQKHYSNLIIEQNYAELLKRLINS